MSGGGLPAGRGVQLLARADSCYAENKPLQLQSMFCWPCSWQWRCCECYKSCTTQLQPAAAHRTGAPPSQMPLHRPAPPPPSAGRLLVRYYGTHSCSWCTEKQLSALAKDHDNRTAALFAWGKGTQKWAAGLNLGRCLDQRGGAGRCQGLRALGGRAPAPAPARAPQPWAQPVTLPPPPCWPRQGEHRAGHPGRAAGGGGGPGGGGGAHAEVGAPEPAQPARRGDWLDWLAGLAGHRSRGRHAARGGAVLPTCAPVLYITAPPRPAPPRPAPPPSPFAALQLCRAVAGPCPAGGDAGRAGAEGPAAQQLQRLPAPLPGAGVRLLPARLPRAVHHPARTVAGLRAA
jgi:hypothetical protein